MSLYQNHQNHLIGFGMPNGHRWWYMQSELKEESCCYTKLVTKTVKRPNSFGICPCLWIS